MDVYNLSGVKFNGVQLSSETGIKINGVEQAAGTLLGIKLNGAVVIEFATPTQIRYINYGPGTVYSDAPVYRVFIMSDDADRMDVIGKYDDFERTLYMEYRGWVGWFRSLAAFYEETATGGEDKYTAIDLDVKNTLDLSGDWIQNAAQTGGDESFNYFYTTYNFNTLPFSTSITKADWSTDAETAAQTMGQLMSMSQDFYNGNYYMNGDCFPLIGCAIPATIGNDSSSGFSVSSDSVSWSGELNSQWENELYQNKVIMFDRLGEFAAGPLSITNNAWGQEGKGIIFTYDPLYLAFCAGVEYSKEMSSISVDGLFVNMSDGEITMFMWGIYVSNGDIDASTSKKLSVSRMSAFANAMCADLTPGIDEPSLPTDSPLHVITTCGIGSTQPISLTDRQMQFASNFGDLLTKGVIQTSGADGFYLGLTPILQKYSYYNYKTNSYKLFGPIADQLYPEDVETTVKLKFREMYILPRQEVLDKIMSNPTAEEIISSMESDSFGYVFHDIARRDTTTTFDGQSTDENEIYYTVFNDAISNSLNLSTFNNADEYFAHSDRSAVQEEILTAVQEAMGMRASDVENW